MKDVCDYFIDKVANVQFSALLIAWMPIECLCTMLQHRNIYDLASQAFMPSEVQS